MLLINSVDESEMSRIHDGSFLLPDLSNKLYISKKSVIAGNKTIAIGLVRLTGEGILITDKGSELTTRARASATVIEALREEVKHLGLEDCHVFIKNERVEKFLQHLGFQVCNCKKAMVIQL